MKPGVAAMLRIDDAPEFSRADQLSRIADLSTHLGVANRVVEHHRRLVLQSDNFLHICARVCVVVAKKTGRLFRLDLRKLDRLLFLRASRASALLFHQLFKPNRVNGESTLASHQFGQVERKAIGVIEFEGKTSRNDRRQRSRSLVDNFTINENNWRLQKLALQNLLSKKLQAPIQRLIKRLFLSSQHFFDVLLHGANFGENIPDFFGNDRNELVKKRLVEFKYATVANCAPQDAAENVTASFVTRLDSIRDRKAQCADVIGDDAEGDVDLFLFSICRAAAPAAFFQLWQAVRLPYNGKRRAVFLPAQLLQLVEDRAEDISLVVRDDAGEIGEIPRALDHRGDALQAQAGIDVPLR